MPRLFRKLAILHKLETTYGINSTPAAVNAMIGTNVSFSPLKATAINRDLLLPYMGNQGVILAGVHAQLEFDVEIAGAGAAGTAPKWGALLRACGFGETVQAGSRVTYGIVEDNVASATIFFEIDGVRHILLGARGTMTMNIAPKAIPHFRFVMTGLLGTITDQALTNVTLAGWQTPLDPSSANTTMVLHGWPSVAESLSINLGNTVVPRFLIGSESVIIAGRSVTGTAVVEATPLATVNWFDRALARTRGALSLVHGKTAGSIVEVAGTALEVGEVTQGQTDGILNYSLPLSFVPVAGRDEFVIISR